jgi:hypothetical protein
MRSIPEFCDDYNLPETSIIELQKSFLIVCGAGVVLGVVGSYLGFLTYFILHW